ncbi:MAG: hypothetical protein HC929_19670 [Leptolyngbyaceae cyanobacterium SM2_5_2]|nr:hypothetical protein [Leptolyngbyaceae cyanobacterium SM2_5_2]
MAAPSILTDLQLFYWLWWVVLCWKGRGGCVVLLAFPPPPDYPKGQAEVQGQKYSKNNVGDVALSPTLPKRAQGTQG